MDICKCVLEGQMKHKYIFGFLFCVLSLCFYLFHIIYAEAKEKAIAELNSRQMIHAKQAQDQIEIFFSDIINFLSKMSESDHIIDMDDQGRNGLDFALTMNPEAIKAITRVDASGKIIYTTPLDMAVIGRDISSQKHVQTILTTHLPVASDVFTAVQGYRAIALHVPVFSGNEFRGTLAVLIDFLSISKRFIQEIRLGKTGYAWMTSREGIELYCPVPGHTGKSVFENYKEYPTLLSMANEMVKGGQGVTTYIFERVKGQQSEPVRKHAVYLPIKIVDSFWTIVVASSEDEVLASLVSFKNKLMIVVGLLLVCSGIFSYYGMRSWGIVREAAERKKAEEALRESEEKYRLLVEKSPLGISLIGKDGRYKYINPQFSNMFGYSIEDIPTGAAWFSESFPDADYRHKVIQAWVEDRDHISIGKTRPRIFTVTCKDGSQKDIYFRPVTMENLNQFIIYEDITERRQAERKLQASHEMFLTVLNSIEATIYVADMKTYEILFMNKHMVESFKGDFTGKVCWDVYRGESAPCKHCTNQILLDNDGRPTGVHVWQGENPVTGKWYVNYDRAIEWVDGRLVRIQIATDITELKRLGSQLQQSQRIEAIGNLAGGIAHDFNNILSSIIGYSELALDDVEKETPLEEKLQEIYTAGKRARDLVKQILAFARQSDEEKTPIRVDTIAEEALKLIRSTIPTTIEIQKTIESDSMIIGNPSQVHQVFLNLCTNAAQAMGGTGGILEVGLKDVWIDNESPRKHFDLKPGNYLKITVSDNGPGIAPDIVDLIFEPYFTTKGVGEGTGMGLAMVYGIVEAYDGKITVDSEPGKGTVFSIYLPTTKKRDAYQPYEEERLPSGRERILFVDDEPAVGNMSSQIFERLGYSVTVFDSSIEALALFRATPNDFDLVITDMTMPNMTGDKLALELMKIRPDIPVILCSGYTKEISDQEALAIGIKAFAYKPIVKAELAKTIRKVLDETKG